MAAPIVRNGRHCRTTCVWQSIGVGTSVYEAWTSAGTSRYGRDLEGKVWTAAVSKYNGNSFAGNCLALTRRFVRDMIMDKARLAWEWSRHSLAPHQLGEMNRTMHCMPQCWRECNENWVSIEIRSCSYWFYCYIDWFGATVSIEFISRFWIVVLVKKCLSV